MLAILLDDKNLELLRGLPWPCQSFKMTSWTLPQDEETIWKNLHRYFSDKLDGIYVPLKCPSRSHRFLEGLHEESVMMRWMTAEEGE
jgi:hypothetical protein